MSGHADVCTEAQPLKEEGAPVTSPGKTHRGADQGHRLSHLSRWRTAAFFISLFLCLTVVFAFSFIIPCPVRPVYLRTWNHTYLESATYDFLAVEDANRDKVLDVLFVLKATVGSLNTSCANESVPCVFLGAAAGTNGHTLWERALTPPFYWAQCGLRGVGSADSGCLVAHAHQLTAIDKYTGGELWPQPCQLTLSSEPPVLAAPDLDGDGVDELFLIGPGPQETKLVVLSGKTGTQIGSEMVLVSEETSRHMLHTTASGSLYLLFQTDSGLSALGLTKIVAHVKPGSESRLKRDQTWEQKSNASSGPVLIYRSALVQQVVLVPKGSRSQDLLLVAGGTLELIDGDSLQSLWKVNVSRVLSEATIGYYNKDDVADIVIEEDSSNGTKQVTILDGRSGVVLWRLSLLTRPNSPPPASLRSIHSVSVFVFWGAMPDAGNDTERLTDRPTRDGRFTYMLHPQHPDAVLENRVEPEHIVAFRATLLERGRHACFLTLTGPEGAELGTVTLAKRKLKEDVPESRVHWLGGARVGEDDQIVKEAFNKVRFKQES